LTADRGATSPAGQDLRALHDRLLADRSLQFDFGDFRPPAPPHLPPWLKALGQLLNQLLGGALPAMKVVFWAGLGAAALAVIWLIVREGLGARFPAWRRRAAPRSAPADWAPDARRARALLENADRLAAQGRFDLAVRLILHRGIEDIEARRPRLVRPALTGRDIAGLEALPPAARGAFAVIAAVVEYSAFAGQPIGEAAFARCRSAYEAFAFPEAWR
jgi:hypothetical protein